MSDDLLLPVAGTAGTGVTVIFIAKTMIENWLKRHDKLQDTVRDLDKSVAVLTEKVKELSKDLDAVAGIARAARKESPNINVRGSCG